MRYPPSVIANEPAALLQDCMTLESAYQAIQAANKD
jgi:hypothetical protein